MALSAPSLLSVDGHTVLADTEAPWGGAKLPDPQAQARNSLASATLPSQRWRPSPAPWPEPEATNLATAVSSRLNARRAPARRPAPAGARIPQAPQLAYDPHGPPFLAR